MSTIRIMEMEMMRMCVRMRMTMGMMNEDKDEELGRTMAPRALACRHLPFEVRSMKAQEALKNNLDFRCSHLTISSSHLLEYIISF